MRYLITLAILVSTIQCQSDKTQQEAEAPDKSGIRIVKEYYDDGSLKSEIEARENLRHGTTKTYSQNGKLIATIMYANNQRHGKMTNYYEDGSISSEINYNNGMKSGDAIKYFPSGEIYRITPYLYNEISGIRKTFWEDGIIQSELPFSAGQEGAGLKEYTHTGQLKKMDAKIVIKEIDEIAMANKLTLRISLSDGTKDVEFYRGVLTDNKYWHDNMERLETKNGKAEIEFYLPRGSFVMETVEIVARRKTSLKNHYILKTSYPLAAENKFNP